MERLRGYLVIGGLVAFVAALVGSVVVSTVPQLSGADRPNATLASEAAEAAVSQPAAPDLKPLGNPDAKLVITAILEVQNNCHAPSFEIMKAIGESAGDWLRVEFVDTNSELGQKLMGESEVQCQAVILFNGKNSVEVVRNGKSYTESLAGPLEMFAKADLIAIIRGAGLAAYGPEAAADLTLSLDRLDERLDQIAKGTGAPTSGTVSHTCENNEPCDLPHPPVATSAPVGDDSPAPARAGGLQGPPPPGG